MLNIVNGGKSKLGQTCTAKFIQIILILNKIRDKSKQTHIDTQTHTHRHTHTDTNTHRHTQTQTHTDIQTHRHTNTHTDIQTHTNTCTHTTKFS